MYSKILTSNLFLLTFFLALSVSVSAQTGTWSQLKNNAPNSNMGVMLLLTDGTVIAHDNSGGGSGTGWNKLTPDITGSYINGTWDKIANMNFDRLFFPSQVLPNGKVFVAGGEYGGGATHGEVYDPVANTWTNTGNVVSNMNVYDGNSEILPNGTVLVGLQSGSNPSFDDQFYNPVTNTWTTAPLALLNHDEAAWLKLPDSSILFVGIGSTQSCRYIPATNTWIHDANVPVSLYDVYGEEAGAAFMLPNGKAIFFGARGQNAIYSPSGNTSPGTWTAAASFPVVGSNQVGTVDAPAAMLPNGRILCAASPVGRSAADEFRAPTYFFEYDYTTNTFAQVTSVLPSLGVDSLAGINCDFATFLLLPTGQVLLGINQTRISKEYWIYTPGSGPIPQGIPVINSVYQTACGTNFFIRGKLFNGISEGAAFGDDWQMSTNYPIVRLTNGTNTYYCKTSNWNRIGAVQTDSLEDTAQLALPAGLPAGTYSLYVVVNGFPSSPYTFTPYATADSIISNVSCHGDSNGNVKAIVFGGITPYTYAWSNASTTVSISNPTGAILSAGTYTLTVTDSAGCVIKTPVTITQPTILAASISVSANVSCNADSNGKVTSTISGGTTPYTYSWSSGATSATNSGLSAGSYTLTVTDKNGCNATASASITQPAVLSISATTNSNVACTGDNSGSVSSVASGGTSPYTYSWSGGGTNSGKTGLTAGTYTITLTDKHGCSATASTIITQPANALSAVTSVTQANCGSNNGTATATPSGGTGSYTYSWSPSGGTDSTATGLAPKTYTLTVIDSNGCNFTASVSVTDTGSLSVTTTITNIKCNGSATGVATAHASGGTPAYTYSWAPVGGTNNNATGLTAGTYTITVTDKNSCVAVASATITQPTALAITKGYVPTYSVSDCNGIAWVKATGGASPYTYSWSPGGATTDSVKSLCNGAYCCVVTDHNGCIDSVCVTVITGIPILDNSSLIKIFPDPNNGIFRITGLSKGQIVEVYNYTGQEISSVEANSATMQFNITDKANGIYLVRILSADGKPAMQTKILKVN